MKKLDVTADPKRRPIFFVNFLVPVIIFAMCSHGEGGRVYHKIYMRLPFNSQCFRLMNGTHQIGCQSSRFGNTGVVHMVKVPSDIDWMEQDIGNHGPFIAVLNMKMWSDNSVLIRLKSLESRVSGVIILFSEESDLSTGGYSADYSCPNPNSGYEGDSYCKEKWNTFGDARWFQDWEFPIFLLEDPAEIHSIVECYEQYNKPINGDPPAYPLCSATLKMWMLGAKDTPTCMRREDLFNGIQTGQPGNGICSPLSGFNKFALIPSTNRSDNATQMQIKSTMIVASRIDSFSMFSDVSPGAESASSSLIALLAVAQALTADPAKYRKLKESGKSNKKHFLLTFLNGESLDYIGSSRLIFDMAQNAFPRPITSAQMEFPHLMKQQHIGFFLEVNQLGLAPTGNNFTAFVDGEVYNKNKTEIDNQLGKLKKFMKSGTVELVSNEESAVVLSSSYQRFLREKISVPGMVITDFNRDHGFNARFYNSFGDRNEQFTWPPADKIKAVAEGVLGAAVSWIDESLATEFSIDEEFTKNLVNCFIEKPLLECEYLVRAYDPVYKTWRQALKNSPQMRTYIGPDRYPVIVHETLYYLMDGLFGERTNISGEDCSSQNQKDFINNYSWIRALPGQGNDTICVRTDSFSAEAKSPAFLIQDYDWASGEYSTWTESIWNAYKYPDSNLKVFLIPNPAWEGTVFGIGLSVMLLSFFSVYFLHSKSDVLFGPCPTDV